MSANAAAKKQKPLKRHPSKLKRMSAYMILTLILIVIIVQVIQVIFELVAKKIDKRTR